ncbi:hypothetical protein GQ600_1944 [Phytophthora cactorum]|nr:hypothetical protein GQ600_1944 [Phytophthora cactorum]
MSRHETNGCGGGYVEAEATITTLRALRSQPQAFDDAFPFIFVPLFHEDCCVGVLSVDSFQNVPKGRMTNSS